MSSFFNFSRHFYEQITRVAMYSPLSPAIASFYMQAFKEEVLKRAAHRLFCWFRYVDDTFIIWPSVHENRTASCYTLTASMPTYSSPWRL
jgi:hypothetical protein